MNHDPGCPVCAGKGWTVDHSDECYRAGDCVGCGGVQVLCGGIRCKVDDEDAEGPF